MYAVIKEMAPTTQIVWSRKSLFRLAIWFGRLIYLEIANFSYGFPYSQTLSGASAADAAAMDTSGNGQLDNTDDAYAPYYPGDE